LIEAGIFLVEERLVQGPFLEEARNRRDSFEDILFSTQTVLGLVLNLDSSGTSQVSTLA